jgi:hypothetical protein
MSKPLAQIVKLKTISQATELLLKEARALADFINSPPTPVTEEWTVETMPYETKRRLTNTLRLIAAARKKELECASHSSATR